MGKVHAKQSGATDSRTTFKESTKEAWRKARPAGTASLPLRAARSRGSKVQTPVPPQKSMGGTQCSGQNPPRWMPQRNLRALARFSHPPHPGKEVRDFISHGTAAPSGALKPAGRQRLQLTAANIKHGGRSNSRAASNGLESTCGLCCAPVEESPAVPWAPTYRLSGGTKPRNPKPTTSSSSM